MTVHVEVALADCIEMLKELRHLSSTGCRPCLVCYQIGHTAACRLNAVIERAMQATGSCEEPTSCTFCGKLRTCVSHLISVTRPVSICNECVQLAGRAIADQREPLEES